MIIQEDLNGNRIAFYHDVRGNLSTVLDPENGLTYYEYDPAGRMTSVKNPWDELTYYEYTPGGWLLKRTLGNGTIAYYRYDAAGRTSKVDNRRSDMSAICSFTYERDAAGNPISILREDGYVVYYGYDAKSQLTSEIHRDGGNEPYAWQWDYDAAGNREYQVLNSETTYYEYNAANELTREYTAATDTYYQYDGSGNTVAKQEASGTTYYQYDFENGMTRIDFAGDSHNYFGYDADSKRVEKRDSDGYSRFVYQGPDMLKLLQEQDADGDAAVQYTMGGALEAMRRANGGGLSGGATSFYHFDWLGSTFALTDAAEIPTDTYLYDAWGDVFSRTGSATNPHTYIGKERYYRMPNASLYHLGFRDYAAGVARFVTVDPRRDGTNWFAYPRNAPASLVEPRGSRFTPRRHLSHPNWAGVSSRVLTDEANARSPLVPPPGRGAGGLLGEQTGLGEDGMALVNAAGGIVIVVGGLIIVLGVLTVRCILLAIERAQDIHDAGRDKDAHCTANCGVTRCLWGVFGLATGIPVWLAGYILERLDPSFDWQDDVRANELGIRCGYQFWRLNCEKCCECEVSKAGLINY